MDSTLDKIMDGSIEAGLMMLELANPRREWTPEEIAEACGCTSSNIRQIEARAMKKLLPAFRRRLTIKEIMEIEIISELDEPVWGVITHDRVLAAGVEYSHAQQVLDSVKDQFGHEATIVTIDVISRLSARHKESA